MRTYLHNARAIMFVAAVLPLAVFLFPLWNITLEAPQYPTPLGMNIHVNDFRDEHPHDIKNINILNHYIGMKYIPDSIPEFKVFPLVIILTSLLGIIFSLKFENKYFLYWFILMCLLSAAGLIDFYLWEQDYGTNLYSRAILKFTNPDGTDLAYQPPVIGTKEVLNFTVHSYPRLGAFFLGFGIILSLYAYKISKIKIR